MGKGSRNRQLRRDRGSPETDVLSLMASRSRSVGDVDQLRGRQVASFVALSTGMPELTPGLDHGRLFLEDLARHAEHEALTGLIERAEDDIRRGFICLVSADAAGVNDICRDLMEIEILFADFHRDASSLNRWATLPARQRSDEYKFGKLLNRVGTSVGVPQGMTHPVGAEYQAHSAGLHPTPDGRATADSHDIQSWLVILGADLIEHVWRVIEVLLALVAEQQDLLQDDAEPIKWDLSQVVAARDAGRGVVAHMQEAAEQAGIQIGPREPFSRKEHPDGANYRFRAAPRARGG